MSKKTASSVTKHTAKGHSDQSDFFKTVPAKLVLADGTTFLGKIPAWQEKTYAGEVVFNTGMTGYVESLTDPSYSGQLLTFTYPLIGNYGVPKDGWESERIQAKGVIVSEACEQWSHALGEQSLLKWLQTNDVPLLTEVDTRALTRYLRSHGTMAGMIMPERVRPAKKIAAFIPHVTISEPIIYNKTARKKVILVDCGMKNSILTSLLQFPVQVHRVPYIYDYSDEQFDGVLVSNGPGDPVEYPEAIAILKKAMAKGKPVFGICLGTQLMARAAGAKTHKLQYGHRGHNQPCFYEPDGRCYLTSQNHGYTITEETLPKGWRVLFRNLNDQSIEGIEHRSKPFFSVQFHPEANPGPTDTTWLFERFYQSL